MEKIIINNQFKKDVIKILIKANKSIMNIYLSENFDVQYKNDNSPLTKADLLAHQIISSGLKEINPKIPIVSEEDQNSINFHNKAQLYWLLDPLDGTKEFINKSGEFTCNIALIKNSQPLYGFVGVPIDGTIYYGGKNKGSYKLIDNSIETPISCSQENIPIRIIMSKSHINEDTLKYIKNLNKDYTTVQAGSSLKFLKIAEGKADLYPRMGLTSEWDTAAAHAVLEGSGGSIHQLNGDQLFYNKENILNPFFIAKGL